MHKAFKLLAEYDELNNRLRQLKPELDKEVADYGRSIGVWGYRIEHLRIQRDNDLKKVG